jgi:hypothetical protein
MSNPGIKLEDLQYAADEPTHEEIQKRAYELYLDKGEQFSSTQYWLAADITATSRGRASSRMKNGKSG